MAVEAHSGGSARAGRVPAASRPRGRDVELAAVEQLIDRLRGGTGGVLVVTGGPGSGKTSILREAALLATRSLVRIGAGAAHPGDQVVELSALLGALFDGSQSLLPTSARPVLRASSEQRYWVLHDIGGLLSTAATEPLLISIDDLQWADPGTFAALRSLPGTLADLPIGWLLASRPPRAQPEIGQLLQTLLAEGAQRFDLGPLDPESVGLIAEDHLRAPPGDLLAELLGGARGDPFTLTELLAGLQEEGLVQVEAGRAVVRTTRLPSRLRDGMRRRLGRMTSLGRQAVVVAASLGSTFTVPALARMLDSTPAQLLEALEEGLAAELLRERRESFAFWHDITRDAVRASIPAAARRALDRQAADVLLAEGALPVEVALQLAASADPGDGPAVTILRRAARQISLNDPGAAADLCLKALELVDQHDPVRATVIGETAVWMYAAARIEEAQRFVDDSLRPGLTAEEEAEVCFSVAGLLELPPDLLSEYGRRALALPGLPAAVRHRHLVRLIWNLQVAGRYEEAAGLLPEARAGVDPTDGQASRFTLQLVQTALEQIDGRLEAALATLDRALAEGPGTRDDARVHIALMWRFAILPQLDRPDEAKVQIREAVADARRHRQAFALAIYQMMRGRLAGTCGRPEDVLSILDPYLPPEVAERGGVIHAAATVAMGRAALHLGDDDQVERACAIAERMVQTSTPAVQRLARWFLAVRAMSRGDAAQAHAWLCVNGVEERLQSLQIIQANAGDEIELARIGRAVHDDELVRQAVDIAQRRADLNPKVGSLAGFAAHARGVSSGALGELRQAADLLGQGAGPMASASAFEDLGANASDLDEAVSALDRALLLYHQAGAEWDVRRVRQRLRARGVHRRLVSTTRPSTGWSALTDAERAVAGLVADGLTNRQVAERLFVSPHTVGTHLRHVFEKLGISSRVDLARLTSRRPAEA